MRASRDWGKGFPLGQSIPGRDRAFLAVVWGMICGVVIAGSIMLSPWWLVGLPIPMMTAFILAWNVNNHDWPPRRA